MEAGHSDAWPLRQAGAAQSPCRAGGAQQAGDRARQHHGGENHALRRDAAGAGSATSSSSERPATGVGAVFGNASSTRGTDDVDFRDLEGLNDLTCCVCKNWAQGNGNKLMECHTC